MSSLLERPPHNARAFGVRSPLAPGVRIGRYEVSELLGEGSMGSVYRARDAELGREVALKRINPGTVSVAAAEDRLRREARAMARVEHAAVVRIYDAEVVEGELFVAMELARGGTLAAWIAGQPHSWREIVRAFVEAGRGLAAAHAVGLVHRDIKPSNILIDRHGRPKISDFGLARTLGSVEAEADDSDAPSCHPPGAATGNPEPRDVSLTRTGAIVGTLAYMAPEQLTGEPIDARADQFAFCVALWEALCGRRPFDATGEPGPSPASMLRAIAGEPSTGDGAAPGVPRRVLSLVRRGLAAERTRRWRTMDELLDALDRAARPRRVWWFATAAAVAGITAVIIVAATRPREAPVAVCGKRTQIAAIWNSSVRDHYLTNAVNTTAAREDAGWFDWYARELEAQYTASCKRADQRRITCLDDAVEDLRSAVARQEREFWPSLRAIDRCGGQAREVDFGDISNGEHVRLSPDGGKLLMMAGGHASVVREAGSSDRRVLDLAVPLKWMPDGSIIGFDDRGWLATASATSSSSQRVVSPGLVVDAMSEARHAAFDSEDSSRSVVDVSSDLARIATIVDGKLTVRPTAGGVPLMESIVVGDVIFVAGSFSPDNRRFAAVVGGNLYIDDLNSRRRAQLVFRLWLEGSPNWSTAVRWLDATTLVVFGGASTSYGGALWRLRVDDDGRVIAPPQILLHNERDTCLLLHDTQPGKLLFERVGMATRSLLIEGESATTLPGLMPFFTTSADRTRDRVLVESDESARHWAWMSIDGTSVAPVPILDGLNSAVVGPTGLVALDLRTYPPALVSFDNSGAELLRAAIPAPRGARPMLRCSASHCMLRWADGSVAVTAASDGRTLSAPVRHARAELGGARVFWDLSPDGTEIATVTTPISSALTLVELGRSVVHRVTSDTCGRIEGVRYLSDGALLLFCVRLYAGAVESVLVRHDAAGHERVLWRGDATILSVTPLDDHRMVLSTILFQRRLAVLEVDAPAAPPGRR